MSLPPDIEAAILNLDQNVEAILAGSEAFIARINTTIDKVDAIIDDAGPVIDAAKNIEKDIDKIEDLLFAILIVVLVMVSIMFVYWFFGHIWPMLAGYHKHKHDMRHVLRDLGTTPMTVVREV